MGTAGTKKILFVTPPGYGHAFPIVPIAWAFRSSGHDVLVVTCGVSVRVLKEAGLQVLDAAPDTDLLTIYRRFQNDFPTYGEHGEPPPGETVFTVIGNLMVHNLIDIAREWKADIIIYTPGATAAPVAVTLLGLPSLFLGLGLSHTPSMMLSQVCNTMEHTLQRFGLSHVRPPEAWIDVAPVSIGKRQEEGWPMRYVPYNGGSTLFRDQKAPKKGRIAITNGTVIPIIYGSSSLSWVSKVAFATDIDFVIAYCGKDVRTLAGSSSNVHTMIWAPLDALLAHCQGVIHHGGSGTSLTALTLGIPQIVMPVGADEFCNANLMERRGAAITADARTIDSKLVGRLLEDSALRTAASEVKDEIAATPSPADIAGRIISLIS